MQLTALRLLMAGLQVFSSSAGLLVVPDRSQFFRYDSFTLSCEARLNSTGWRVKRRTEGGGVRPCTSGWGTASSGSTCVIGDTYPSDSGEYWCETGSGDRSANATVVITDRAVLLESPALPVPRGAAVTLGCRAETAAAHHTFTFLRDGLPVGSGASGKMTIRRASEDHQGLYACRIPGVGESLGSRLTVDGSPHPPSSDPPAASCSASRLMLHLLVGSPYLLATVLLALICRDRSRAQTFAGRRDSVVMEMAV